VDQERAMSNLCVRFAPDDPATLHARITALEATVARLETALHDQTVLLQNVSDAIIVTDAHPPYQILQWTGAAERIYGWSAAEAVGQSFSSLRSPTRYRDTVTIDTVLDTLLQQGYWSGTLIDHHRDGRELLIELAVRGVPGSDGRPHTFVTVSREVNARLQLAETRAHLAAIVESSPDAIVSTSLDGTIISWNSGAQQIYGYTAVEAIGARIGLIVPTDRRDELEALHAGVRMNPFETVRQRKDGMLIDVALTAVTLLHLDGEVIGSAEIARDITTRKRMEAMLRQERDFSTALLNTVGALVVVLDRDGRIVRFNRACEQLTGYTFDEVRGKVFWDVFLLPEDSAVVQAAVTALLEGASSHSYENTWRTRAGEDRQIAWANTVLCDTTGRPEYIIGTGIDMTEHRLAEAALRAQEQRYRMLIERLPLVIFQADRTDVNRATYVSPQIEALLGYTPGEWCANPKLWISHVHPDDLAKVLAVNARFQATGIAEPSEHRMLARDGRVVWVRDEAVIVQDDPGQAAYVLGITQDITARRQAETALRESEAKFRSLFSSSMFGIMLCELGGMIWEANDAFLTMLGYTRAELLAGQLNWRQLTPPGCQAADDHALAELRTSDHCTPFEKVYLRKDGTTMPVLVGAVCLPEQPQAYAAYVIDLTERKRLEAQVLQAQRLDSVGRLAGGIAHDFNNLLLAIGGYTELALDALESTDPVRADLEEVRKATARAASLTRQLLTFARHQPHALQISDLVTGIHDLLPLLRQAVGEAIALQLHTAPDLWPVHADLGQIEQVLLNLTLNARDAMPRGGTLTITAANVLLNPREAAERGDVPPGDYVRLSVRDTGMGMPPEVQARAFEPFFTTKGLGKGTGLGLASCYGIVRQHSGTITVTSQIGQGTTVQIDLPRAALAATAPTVTEQTAELSRGTETVLLVEDEMAVRALAARVLRQQGYQVLEAGDGRAALQVAASYPQPIQLLLSDVVMPELDGIALAEQLAAARPDLQVLLMSGYADGAMATAALVNRWPRLQKPFTRRALVDAVRAALDRTRLRPINRDGPDHAAGDGD
jgi:PAS domain S-box-containing protein